MANPGDPGAQSAASMGSSVPDLGTLYERLRFEGSQMLLDGRIEPEPIPIEGSPRWGLSAVLVPAGIARDRLRAELDRVNAAASGKQTRYGLEGLHVTVRSLEGYVDEVPSSVVAVYTDQVEQALIGLDDLYVRFDGLAAGAASVFATGHPSPGLTLLRHRLHQIAQQAGHQQNFVSVDTSRCRETAHCTLAVLTERRSEPALARLVAGGLEGESFEMAVDKVDLVRYRLDSERVHVDMLGSIPTQRAIGMHL